MAETKPNSFTTYNISEESALQGSILTEQQKQVLHNRRTILAEAKLYLTFDPEKQQEFVRDEAYLRGQIELINDLLTSSEEANITLNSPKQTNGIGENGNEYF